MTGWFERIGGLLEHGSDPFEDAGPRPSVDGSDYTHAVGADELYDHVRDLAEDHGYEDRPIRENQVGDVGVVHIGAQHTMDEFNEYEDFYAAVIGAADAIMVEDPVGTHFYEEYGDPHFFSSVGELAADQDKPVYETDPHTAVTTLTDFGIIPVGVGSMVWQGWELLNGGGMDDVATGLLGAYAVYGTLGGHLMRANAEQAMTDGEYDLEDAGFIMYSLNDWLQWGETDYRNVMMADNTVTICQEEDIETLVTFQGAAHTDKISGYMDDRIIRKASKLPYLPYLALSRDGRHPKKFTRELGEWREERV